MGFFNQGKTPDMPALVEFPKPGEPVEFDHEEQIAIDVEIARANRDYFKDRVFPDKKTATQVSLFYASTALTEVAKRRLENGDLEKAASSCVKAIVLSNKVGRTYEGDWLLLAEMFARHGDVVRAKTLVEVAKKIYKNNTRLGIKMPGFEPVWKEEIRMVEDIIKSRAG